MTHIYTRTFRLGLVAIILTVLAACSTTKNLAEGEQLYIGIEDITFSGEPTKAKHKSLKNDTTGVITSIAGAVDAVGAALNGGSTENTEMTPVADTPQTEEQLREEAAELLAYETTREEVEAVLAYAPNGALFGSSSLRSPLPTGLWLYNGLVNSKNIFGKWIFKNFAATPIYISTVNPETRARVATNTLRNYGYFSARVSAQVLPQKNPKKAKVAYNVYAGPVHRLDSIAYLNFSPKADSLLRATHYLSLLKKGEPFSVLKLSNEQLRIENLFRENGYFFYSAPYTTYRADTLQRKNYVQLQVAPLAELPQEARKQWYMGHTYVSVRRTETDVLDQTIKRRNNTYHYSGDDIPLRTNMWRRAISHHHGELFRLSDSKSTIEKLGAMGIFSQMDINYMPQDTTATCDTLDLFVSAMMDKLYDSSFEMNATLKSNQQIGPGLAYSIAKRNAFRGGEKVSFKIFGSYEWQMHSGNSEHNSLLNSYEVGTELALEFPRFILPGISRKRFRYPSSTTFALNANWRNRASYFQMISFGGNVTYKWNTHATSRHELTLFSLDYDKLIHKTADFDSIMSANPALYVSMRDRFVPSISYTFTYASAAGHRNPVWLQFSAKEAGNIVSGIYAVAGQSWSKKDKDLFGTPFAQYLKLTAEMHETFRISSRYHIAARLFAGAIFSYGNSTHAPYADQFYVGGANSVRAFTARTVGPGSYRSTNSKYAYIDQTGDIKLEANVEFRARLFGSLHGAVFLDAGNVWLMREDPLRPGGKLTANTLKNIAVGTGAGLRYDLEFLILRFDVGIGLHAPYKTSRSGFYNLERFRDGFAFHFAIGYPF